LRTDPDVIRRLAREIEDAFRGAKARDVGLLPDGRTAIELWSRGERVLLAIDIFFSPPIVTVEREELPIAAEPGFVRALGAALRGTVLQGASSRKNDRLLRLTFGTRSRFGVHDSVELYIELVPRFGNIVLVKGDVIVAATKEFPPADNAKRSIQVGSRYEFPPLIASPRAPSMDFPEDRSVLAALRTFRERAHSDTRTQRDQQRRRALLKRLDQREKKIRDELAAVAAKRSAAMTRESLREEGDAIYASLHETASHEEREEAKSRAVALFARYKKLSASLRHLEEREASLTRTLEGVEELRWEAERAAEAVDLEDVELAAAQLDPRRQQLNGPPPKRRKRAPLEIRTAHGSRILVGRSPTENAELTFHVARPNDLWFHTQAVPGAHVILQRTDRTDPPQEDIARAASLAAHFSKAHAGGSVPVEYTRRKYVRAQRDAAPGLVWYTDFKTITVKPEGPELAR
jgi:predicted ribosome quality control (RQC) complex YloA/Tae2 family protein